MAEKPIKRGRGSGAGWAPYAAAKRCEIAWPRFQKAMKKGEVEVIEFGDLERITDLEIARIRGLHGLSPTPESPDEPPMRVESKESSKNVVSNDRAEPPLEAAE